MADKILWLPILMDLGEDIVARIMDKSPDTATAILEARENFKKAEDEANDLRKLGHEDKTDPQ